MEGGGGLARWARAGHGELARWARAGHGEVELAKWARVGHGGGGGLPGGLEQVMGNLPGGLEQVMGGLARWARAGHGGVCQVGWSRSCGGLPGGLEQVVGAGKLAYCPYYVLNSISYLYRRCYQLYAVKWSHFRRCCDQLRTLGCHQLHWQ